MGTFWGEWGYNHQNYGWNLSWVTSSNLPSPRRNESNIIIKIMGGTFFGKMGLTPKAKIILFSGNNQQNYGCVPSSENGAHPNGKDNTSGEISKFMDAHLGDMGSPQQRRQNFSALFNKIKVGPRMGSKGPIPTSTTFSAVIHNYQFLKEIYCLVVKRWW